MNTTAILQEMIDIANDDQKPRKLLGSLAPDITDGEVQAGCKFIRVWLRYQSVTIQIRPQLLVTTADRDLACMKLIESSPVLQEMFQIKNGYLCFDEAVSLEEAKAMTLYVEENYDFGEVRFTPR
jgi:hypothetical protein